MKNHRLKNKPGLRCVQGIDRLLYYDPPLDWVDRYIKRGSLVFLLGAISGTEHGFGNSDVFALYDGVIIRIPFRSGVNIDRYLKGIENAEYGYPRD